MSLGVLGACGFQPLYGGRGVGAAVRPALAQIQVMRIPDRIGQQVRNNLLDSLTPRGAVPKPAYRLNVALTVEKEGLAIQIDDQVTRYNLTLTAHYRLLSTTDGRELHKGSTRSIAAFNVAVSDYATLIAERDALTRTARDASDEITMQLAVFFSRKRTAS